MMEIAIIGAGVIASTTAIRICETFGNLISVTIFTEEMSPNTTGDISAGLWGPYLLLDTPEHKIIKWAKDTHDFFHSLWKNGEASRAGICLQPVSRVTKKATEYNAFWRDIVFGITNLSRTQLTRLNEEHNTNYSCGVNFISFTCETMLLLPYLYEKLTNIGVRIELKRITSFLELRTFDLIINCSGLGAQQLTDDEHLKPIRGQVMRVKAPWIFQVLLDDSDDGNYIIPNINTVVLGGTHQMNDYDTAVNEVDTKFIYEGCAQMIPSIKYAQIIGEMVGLRPGRSCVRIEQETFKTSDGKWLQIIHNYGHGGAGVTLSYGCAGEVCELIRKYIEGEQYTSDFPPKSKL